jgi:hypothetical protein
MTTRLARSAWLAIMAVPFLVGGCGRAGASAPATPPATTPSAATNLATEPPPDGATSVEPTDAAASPGGVPMPEPPAASLAVDGGDPVVGELGSFTWQGSGSDSPWLPGSRIHVGTGERLTMTLAEPLAIEHWTAVRVPSVGLDAAPSVGLGEGDGPPAFGGPPAGSWSVQVSVWFAGNLGSASYYWLVDVD